MSKQLRVGAGVRRFAVCWAAEPRMSAARGTAAASGGVRNRDQDTARPSRCEAARGGSRCAALAGREALLSMGAAKSWIPL